MFSKLNLAIGLSAIATISISVPATAEFNEQWLTMGETRNGSILSLEVTSIQTKPHAGNWLWFRYRITDKLETRDRIGFTGACKNGRLAGQPVWLVELVGEDGIIGETLTIKADSPGSIKLLRRVCAG